MRHITRIYVLLACGAFGVGVVGALLVLREPTERLSADALAKAEARWRSAHLSNYDLRYRMHGSVYTVRVRGNIVTELEVNGQPARTGSAGEYSVTGLFKLLALELENLDDPRGPFAGRRDSVVMRVRFHPTLYR
ncbi:MAG: hypothetical protein ACE5EX_04400 [Phycisphaerae bacterium]